MKPDDELREEIDSHLAMRREWNEQQGLSPADARQAAHRQFGGGLRALEDMRAVHRWIWLDQAVQDVRYSLRGFRHSPGFAAIAIATLAIGIGASTAVFSAVDPLLFRPLPYPHGDRLVSVGYFGPVDSNEFQLVSTHFDWRREQVPFESLTAMRTGGQCDLGSEVPRTVPCYQVEANFLPTLGVAPLMGRLFTADEDRPGGPRVALISDALWQSEFGGDASVLDRTITVDEQRVRILGVLPRGFVMPQLGEVDLLQPARFDESLPHSQASQQFIRSFARLREGVTVQQAREQLQPLFEDSVRKDVPAELRSDVRLVVRSLRDRQYHDLIPASWMLLGAVGALLLLACFNVANLLLARTAARRRELALRAAIGAGRGRLIRQMSTESLILALAGGTAGTLLALVLVRLFVRLASGSAFPFEKVVVDARILIFSLAVSVLSAFVFGVFPCTERPNSEALAGWRNADAVSNRLRVILVTAQIAASLVLLSGATLLSQSLSRLQNQPLGFTPDHLISATINARGSRYQRPEERGKLLDELETRLSRLPSDQFAMSDSSPLAGSLGRPFSNIRVANRPPLPANGGLVMNRWVTPGYFRALHIPMIKGRDFTEFERASGEAVVILNSALARKMFGAESPLGERIDLDGGAGWSSIVGVVADSKNIRIDQPADPEYYRLRPKGRPSYSGIAWFRTGMNSEALAKLVRDEVASIDPNLPVTFGTLQERVDRQVQQPRLIALLVVVFASSGLLLAAVGLYGVMSFLVTQRTREIGVRMALGARGRDVAIMIARFAGFCTAAGAIVGVLISVALARLARTLLFEVSPYDLLSLGISLLVLAIAACLAAGFPSARAARMNPAVSLRTD
jgi:predicted permease